MGIIDHKVLVGIGFPISTSSILYQVFLMHSIFLLTLLLSSSLIHTFSERKSHITVPLFYFIWRP